MSEIRCIDCGLGVYQGVGLCHCLPQGRNVQASSTTCTATPEDFRRVREALARVDPVTRAVESWLVATIPETPLHIVIHKRESPYWEGVRYAITQGPNCLNRNGEWEYEPTLSSRDDGYYERCRWTDFTEAWNAAVEAAKTDDCGGWKLAGGMEGE